MLNIKKILLSNTLSKCKIDNWSITGQYIFMYLVIYI